MKFRINLVSALVAAAITTMTSAFPCTAQVDPYYEDGPGYAQLLAMYMAVPDHCCVGSGAKALMTADLYSALWTAWHVPEVAECFSCIGENEFLYYFVSGNGDVAPSHTTIDFTKPVKASDGCWYVTMTITLRPDVETYQMTHELKMVLTKDGFLLDDFDGAKGQCRDYINSKSNEFKDIAAGMTVSQYMDKYVSQDMLSFYQGNDLVDLRSNLSAYLDAVRKFVREN